MKKALFLLLIFSLALSGILMNTAQATLLVDTGPGPQSTSGWDVSSHNWLAAEFSLASPSTLTSVAGWITREGGSGPLTAFIYTNVAGLPGTQIYSAAIPVSPLNLAGWYGPTGLNWNLDAGNYWAAFGANSDFFGVLPFPVPNPLGNYAARPGAPTWYPVSNPTGMGFGVQIEGNAVPLPGSLLLLGSGLLGLVGWRRLRKG